MQLIMNVLGPILIAMFIVGAIGSILVIAISFADNVRSLFTKGE